MFQVLFLFVFFSSYGIVASWISMQNNLLLFFITWKEKYFLELLILNQFGIINKWAKSYQTCNVAEIRKVWFRRLFLLIWQNLGQRNDLIHGSDVKKIAEMNIKNIFFVLGQKKSFASGNMAEKNRVGRKPFFCFVF